MATMDDLLNDLERRVEKAAKAIEKLKRENTSLKAKVKKLGGNDPKGADKAAWRKEREVVQKRLSQLAGNLDELL
jgi:cell division protein FtsB